MAAQCSTEPSGTMERTLTPGDLKALLASDAELVILDVRRKDAIDADPVMIVGAQWFDPEQIAQWCDRLPSDKQIVLYCVHGQSISNAVVDYLHATGRRARFIVGGFDAWKACGGPLTGE